MIPENQKLATQLERMASLLFLAGADRFRVKAYRTAARSIAGARRDVVAETRTRGVPKDLPGVGPRISQLLWRYAEEGALPGLEDLEREWPLSLLELLRIPRLGVRRIRILKEKLGIHSLEALREAALAHRLSGVKGLGSRVEREVLRALGTHPERMPHRRAGILGRAQECTRILRGLEGVREVYPAGALRRRQDLVPSLDFVLLVSPGVRASDLALTLRDWARIEEESDDRLGLRLEEDLPVHLVLTGDEELAATLLKETGSEAHLEGLRSLAGDRPPAVRTRAGGRVSEAALVEEPLYRELGLAYVEPELRENRGEIEAARQGTLPRLIRLEDLRGDLHSHTDRSDGRHSLEEMAEAAQRAGLSYLAITDHTQSLKIARGQNEERLRGQMEAIDRLNPRLEGFRLLKAAEVDILEDGSLDLPDDLLRDLDLTVCSIHSRFTLPPDRQTERVLRAMEHPSFFILGHPTGRLLLRREGHPLDLGRIIQAARDLGRILELNGQPDRLDLDDEACRRAKNAGVRIAISSDSHSTGELGNLLWGIDQARRGWLEAKDVVNTLPLPEFLRQIARG